MKLISEEIQNAEYLVEETNGKKNYKIRGVFLQSDLKNRNGRVYPKDILNNEVERYNREFINKKRAFGELGLIDEGAQLGVSSRGMGSLEQRGGANYVKDDFYLATAADIVADPSAPDAFVEGIMESKEWVWDNGVLVEKSIESWKREIDSAKRHALAEAKIKVFKNFLSNL